MIGYVAEMDFRLGKYTLNGTFVGFEKLSTQFTYCGRKAPDTEYGSGEGSSSKYLKVSRGAKRRPGNTTSACDERSEPRSEATTCVR